MSRRRQFCQNEIQQVWIHSFSSSKIVAISIKKEPSLPDYLFVAKVEELDSYVSKEH